MRQNLLAVFTTMILVLALATVAMAADPIIGTWKLNIAKSSFSPILQAALKQSTPKEGKEVYRAIEGNQIELTYTRTRTDGSSTLERLTWPAQGGALKNLLGGIEGESLIETAIGSGNWLVTNLHNGKQFATMHKVISKDGKTMTQTIRGVDDQGKPFKQIQVFDRQ